MTAATNERKQARRLEGVVTSHAREKTLTVEVVRKVVHPLYKKFIKQATSYHVHDEKNEGATGDLVEIIESRPISKTKRWRLGRVIKKGDAS